MFNISDYLKKFTRIEGETFAQREVVGSVLRSMCGIDKVSFEVKKGVIYVKGSPVLKSIIYTKKAAILAALRDQKIIDIR